MKKITALLLYLFAVRFVTFADGTVFWASISPVFMTAQTNMTYSTFGDVGGYVPFNNAIGAASGHPPSGPAFFWELLHAPYQGSQLATPTSMSQLISQGWSSSGLMATNGSVSGRLVPVSGNTAANVPWNAGETNSIMMVGWSANLGASWGVVSNVLANWDDLGWLYGATPEPEFFGLSATGFIASSGSNPGSTLFSGSPLVNGLPINSANTQLYQVVSVPEPSTQMLGSIAAIGLLIVNARRSRRCS